MVVATKRRELNAQTVLSMVSEYDIYRMYYPGNLQLNKKIKSPFPDRSKEKNASFVVSSIGGRLFHIDYGDSIYRGSCFDFVAQMELIDYNSALLKVDRDFGLGIMGSSGGEYKKIVSQYQQPEIPDKRPELLQVVTRKVFTKSELAFWQLYHISLEELRENHVYAVRHYYVDKVKIPIPENEPVFGYFYEGIYWKIYRPYWRMYGSSMDKEGNEIDLKFRTNCPIDLIEGLENIKECTSSIVTKSKKDYIILRKFLPCVCAVQNESMVALNELSVNHLKEHGGTVYINYDCDPPGKKNSWRVTSEFGFKHINVPDKYLEQGIKDFSDMAKAYGLGEVEKYLKHKKLI